MSTDSDVAPYRFGKPDLYNFIPSRHVTLEEAKEKGWDHFFQAVPCEYGHVAPRYVKNKYLCVDCLREQKGKVPLSPRSPEAGPRHEPQKRPRSKNRDPVLGYYHGAPAHKKSPKLPKFLIEPTPDEKKLLEAYANLRSFEEAAASIGWTKAQAQTRYAISESFRKAVDTLEAVLGIRKDLEDAGFTWNDDKRERLLTVYVDTGDIATARDAVQVTPSQFIKELERNKKFKEQYEAAKPLAENILEERAYQLALKGNDKLLTKLLTAARPEKYTERVNMNVNVTEKLSDEQIDNQLKRLYEAAKRRIAQVNVQRRETPVIGVIEAAGQESIPESDQDLLCNSSSTGTILEADAMVQVGKGQ